MRHLDLFSGIGGFALAARWAGWETVGFCEIDPYCQKVLRKHWPDVPIYDDIRKLTGEEVGPVDIISGGYPCQPFSVAGKRRGEEDDRHLWPEFARLIREIKPAYVVGENVAGHINMGLDDVLSDLEGEGYTTESFVIPACALGAVHRRDRVWIIAYTSGQRGKRLQHQLAVSGECGSGGAGDAPDRINDAADPLCKRQQGQGRSKEPCNTAAQEDWEEYRAEYALGWPTEPPVRGRNDGVSKRLDKNRLTGLGNAIVPQVAEVIFRSINELR